MRASSVLAAFGASALAATAVVACAASESDEQPSRDGGRAETVPDAAVDDVEASVDASAGGRVCSAAGWCETSLPDEHLTLVDVWPLVGHAFAIAESPSLGVKVLEWSEVEAKWAYIDDSTQNEPGSGAYGGKIWAPSENEVYFGVAPGYIYRGTRSSSPKTAWTWTRERLQDNGQVGDIADWVHGHTVSGRSLVLGVWGTSESDVYAWFKNTIYRRRTSGGAPEWLPEHVADDFDDGAEHLFFLSAAGTKPGDIWFSGARSRVSSGCALLVRKTDAGYERIADGTASDSACTPRAGALMIGGTEGRLTDLQAVAADHFVALKGARDAVRIKAVGDSYVIDVTSGPGPSVGVADGEPFTSLWSTAGTVWFTASGLVVRGTDPWGGGKYEVSTIALMGAPIGKRVYQVRGTSQSNLWAIGEHFALHKTAP